MKHFQLPQLPRGYLSSILGSAITLILFATFTAIVGGDAINGKIEEGRYFVCGILRDSQGAALYKEVSRLTYLTSASLCFLASIALFLIANRVLYLLEKQGLLKPEKTLRNVLNAFFGLIFGSIGIYSLVTIVRALSG